MSRVASLRSLATDGGWVLAGLLFSFFGSRGANEIAEGRRPLDALGWIVVFVAPLLLLAVRARPRATFAAAVLVSVAYLLRNYPGGPVYLVPVAAAAVLGWRLPLAATWLPVTAGGVVLALAAATHLDGYGLLGGALAMLLWLLVPFTPWAVAALLRMNRLSARQTAAENERRARDEERVRIARDVHDVVGHSLAVISMQANVALHVHARRPEQATVALEAISRSSHDALDQLRRTLDLLRGNADHPEPVAGEPGLADLELLVADFVAGGQRVELTRHGDAPPGGRDVETAAYRIVQESLTNVARHGGDVAARVEVTAGVDALRVQVTNHGPRPVRAAPTRPGSGVAGMRERCHALGGTLAAGPDRGGGWRVRAELPYGGRT